MLLNVFDNDNSFYENPLAYKYLGWWLWVNKVMCDYNAIQIDKQTS